MEFTEEQITEMGLSDDQLSKVQGIVNTNEETAIADLKKEYDQKANENAEAIISGAAQKVEQLTGIKRQQGQKIADYLSTASNNYFENTRNQLQQKETELQEKLKSGNGSETLKKELEETKQKLDGLKKIEAEYSEWKEADYKGKFEKATNDLSNMKKHVAWSNVKPSFPDTVNEWEAKGRWKEFQDKIELKYNIEFDENNNPIAIDKENQYKIYKLSDLVKTDKTISELAKGREAKGLGSGEKTKINIEGLPFKIPEGATAKERTQAITEYLVNDLKLPKTSDGYAQKFAEFNKKILEKIPKVNN